MTVSPTSSTPATSSTSGSSTDAMAQLSGNFSTFLTLLTTQLKNQDPTSPMDSNEFTQQLVMYSQVEQQIESNDNLKTLISQGTTNAATMANAYLGKTVSVTNGQASLSSGSASWSYTLGTDAASTTLTVTNASGKVVYTGKGETAAGNHSLAWDGKDNNGNQLDDGVYTLAVSASDSNGKTVTTSVASAGVVGQLDMTSGTPKLVIGNKEVGLGDNAAVAN